MGGRPTTARERSFEPDRLAGARLDAFMAGHLPGSVGPEIYTKTCLYTMPPDRDFVIDRLPDQPSVFVALGAAHAFKFSSVIGRILSELIVDGATPSAPELERFTVDRRILLEEDPPTSFMV